MDKIDIGTWVENDPDNIAFRQAAHTILHAISITEALQSSMIMKGGVLLALGYRSQRYTRDIDFSTPAKLDDFDQEWFREALEEGLLYAVENLGYGLDCRVQRIKQRPARDDASFPTINTTIGYAYKTDSRKHKRLQRGQATDIIKLDYSLNESIGNTDFFELEDGNVIKVYDIVELISEKFRALLQQEVRNRVRAQDLYDLYYILDVCSLGDESELKSQILKRLLEKSNSRGLTVNAQSMASEEIRNRSREGYKTLPDLVEEELQDFEIIYNQVEELYASLPWEQTS